MKRGQGKNLGWMQIKKDIINAIIKGADSREKLKAIFTPHIVSSKDIDYHLRGTLEKPGLIRRGVLNDKKGKLTLNLQTASHLERLLSEYILSFSEFKRALDLEFSLCYLSDYGDFISLQPSSDEEYQALSDYRGWVNGYVRDDKRMVEQRFIEFARKEFLKKRGPINDNDKLCYIIVFYSLISSIPSSEELADNPELEESYEKVSLADITLVWKDMSLIREIANKASRDTIKTVFERLLFLAEHSESIGDPVIAGHSEEAAYSASGIMGSLMYEEIEKLVFDINLFLRVRSFGRTETHIREMIKILTAEKAIPLHELDRLTAFLKSFNDLQSEPVKRIISNTEKDIEKYYGRPISYSSREDEKSQKKKTETP